MYEHSHLRQQPEWRGRSLIVKNILVCERCLDKPNEQLRTILIPADPIPVQNPRPIPPYLNDENYFTWGDGTEVTWSDGTVVESSNSPDSDGGVTITAGDGTELTWSDGSFIESSGK